MPDVFDQITEEAPAQGDVFDQITEEAPAQGDVFDEIGKEAHDLSKINLDPFHILVDPVTGLKPESGMESGTELTTALAGGALSAAAAIPPMLQSIADLPTRVARGVAMGQGHYADLPPVGEERAAQAEGFGAAMQKPFVSLDIFKPQIEEDDPKWSAAIKEAAGMIVSIPEFIESPLGVLTMGAGLGGKAATTVARYGFAADMVKSMFQQVPQLRDNWETMSDAEKGKAIAQFLGTSAMVGLLAHPEIRGTVKDPLANVADRTGQLAPDVIRLTPDGRPVFGAEPSPFPIPLVTAPGGAAPAPSTAQLPPPAQHDQGPAPMTAVMPPELRPQGQAPAPSTAAMPSEAPQVAPAPSTGLSASGPGRPFIQEAASTPPAAMLDPGEKIIEGAPNPAAAPTVEPVPPLAETPDFVAQLIDTGMAESKPMGESAMIAWERAIANGRSGELPVEHWVKGITDARVTFDPRGRSATFHVAGYTEGLKIAYETVTVTVLDDGTIRMLASSGKEPNLLKAAVAITERVLRGNEKPTTPVTQKALPPVSTPPAAAPAPAEKPAAKEPWQMTKDEVLGAYPERSEIGSSVRSIQEAVGTFRKISKAASFTPNKYNLAKESAARSKVEQLHRSEIEKALSEGKPVPPEVLADYPDLKPADAPAPAETTAVVKGIPVPKSIPFGRISELRSRPDADLIVVKPGSGAMDDYVVKKYTSRKALEAFLKNPGKWSAVVKNPVEKNMLVNRAFEVEKATTQPTPAAPAPGTASLVNPPNTGLELGAGISIPGLDKFAKEDLIPIFTELAETLHEAGAQIRNALSPPSAGPEARLGAGIIRENRAKLAQQDVQARELFAKAKATMDNLAPADALAFIDGIETGAKQPTPSMDALAKDLSAGYAPRIAAVQAVNPKALQHLLQDYFPHIWKDPEAAVSWYARILGRRPLRGPASFLKQRTIPTTADGVAAGLEPVTHNPVELTLLKYHEMDRYVMGQKIFQEFKDKGLAKFSRSDIAPAGYAKINDRVANVVEYRPTVKADGTPGAPERVLRGHWYVHEDAARVLNNFLSPGLERFRWFRALRWAGNNINMAQLGLSGYHFNFTMIDSATSKLSLGIEQAAQGKLKGAATMARGVAGVPMANQLEYYLKGSKVLQEYTKPGSVGGDYAQIVDGLIAAGGRTEMPRIFKNSSLENFTKSLRAGNYPGAVFRAPFAAIEAVSYPLMQNIVPRLKLGAFSDMARSELQRLGPNVTRDQLRASMGRIWDSVDNRMGELVYDNLFWNRTLKDLSFLAVRAVGWNLGTIRELGGGVLDSAKVISRARAGDPIITKRMAYLVALPVTVGIMGGLYQKLKTGKNPETLRDYFYPLTGQTLPDGTPERVNFPSYLKDIGSYSRHPLVTLGHKLHPMWSTVIEMLNNKDFYGAQIANWDDPLVKVAAQEMTFLAKTFIPFSVKGGQRRVGAKLIAGFIPGNVPAGESFMGVMPISPEIARTPAQNKIMEYAVRRMPQGAKTPEQQTRYELSKETNQLLQDPKDLAKAKAQLLQQQKEGTLTKGQRQYQTTKLRFETQQMNLGNSKSEAQWLWRFKHLDLDEAQHVYDIATPAEQKVFDQELKRKRIKAGVKPEPKKDVFDFITE